MSYSELFPDEGDPDAPDLQSDLTSEQIDTLLEIVAADDLYKRVRASVLRHVMRQFPNCPKEVLKRITVTPGKTGTPWDVSTNAALVLGGWLNKQGDAP